MRAVSAALLALAASASVSAQETQNPLQKPTQAVAATPDKKPIQEWQFEPRISLATIYTNNVDLAPPGFEEHELAMQIAPEIGIKRSSERLDLDVNYRFERIAYQ